MTDVVNGEVAGKRGTIGLGALSNEDISRTVNFARIVLIVGLVFLHYDAFPNLEHSPFNGIKPGEHAFASYLNSFVVFLFFSVVPLLSAISGWLFFSFPDAQAETALPQRMRRRFVSLYLPLVFWNALFLAGVFALFVVAPANPLLAHLNIDFNIAKPIDYVNAVFALQHSPVGFQFWFVRDLFMSALVSPVLFLLLRRAPYLGLAALMLVWLSGYVVPLFIRMDVPVFFYLGGLLRREKAPLRIGLRLTLAFAAAYLACVALRAAAPLFLTDATYYQTGKLAVATRLMRLIGVVACWGLFVQAAATQWGARVAKLGGLAFFLHAAHFPLLAEVKLVLWRLVPAETDAWMLVHYVASVLLTVAIGIGAGLVLARRLPGIFALFNGGRHLS